MHIYQGNAGQLLPSVTEIIQKTRPLSEVIKLNKAIEAKKEREGMSNADWDAYMCQAQDRGTSVHTYMETYIPLVEEANGFKLEDKEVPKQLLEQIRDTQHHWEQMEVIGDYIRSVNWFFRDLNKQTRDWSIVSMEETLVNEELNYGGRCDVLLRIGDRTMLVDLKTNGGYWSKWKQCQVYNWNLWRKPAKVDVLTTKVLADGTTKMVKKKDVKGKVIRKSEDMPPAEERDWDWVDNKIKDKFIQLCLYILAARDMYNRGLFDHPMETAAILVAFPTTYQFIKLPTSVWQGCQDEAKARVEQYMNDHFKWWELEAALLAS
jgi:hypothetical protein